MHGVNFKHSLEFTTTTNLVGKQIKIVYSPELNMCPKTAEVLINKILTISTTHAPDSILIAINSVFESIYEDTVSLTVTVTGGCFLIE